MLAKLPIDDVLPALVAAVRDRGVGVLVAPPGAGKTTRVPGALLDASLVDGEIVVLQPRRLAARMAAARVASERSVELGREVGYEVRFDRKVSGATRIRFVTEGVLTRRLLSDPTLRGVGCVIIDEFHERHLDGDLALALVSRLRATRPELRLVVMSATLDAEPVAAFLDNAPIVRSEGRTFPVTIEHEEQPDDRPLGKRVASAVRRLAQGDSSTSKGDGASSKLDGDILVFLPGSGEIRRVAEDLSDAAAVHDLEVLPLHGDLTADEQDRAVRPSKRRKVILATNVAETSITIDGVVAVIDSGLARIARHSPWTGLASLQVEPVSRASCTQRAGRAGRTRPGRVIRLYTKHDHDLRRAFEVPEIQRSDLAGPALELYGAGIGGIGAIRWYEPPPELAIKQADELLVRLGAIELLASPSTPTSPSTTSAKSNPQDSKSTTSAKSNPPSSTASFAESSASRSPSRTASSAESSASMPSRSITRIGRRMLRFPIHPRLARLIFEAEERGAPREACTIAAAVGARELRLERRGPAGQARVSSSSDLLDDLDAMERARSDGMRADRLRREGLDIGTAHQVARTADQLVRNVEYRAHGMSEEEIDEQLLISILTAFPDRVGKRRAPRSSEIVFAGGGSGTLSPGSSVIDAELLVAVDVAEVGAKGAQTKVQIRRASAIQASWLLDLFLDHIEERDELAWDGKKERVERVVQMTYDGLAFDEHRDVDGARRAGRPAAELLARQAIAAGIEKFVDKDELAQWRARVTLAAKLSGKADLAAPDDEGLARVIANACEGSISFAELRAANLLALLDAGLGEHRALVQRLAPTHLQLTHRRRAPIHYSLDQPPWIASRMQDFFGLPRAPSVGDGKVPLVVHLLAPNQRPVQVTSDLPGFWVKHYPALRKQLMRRYPKHQWPEDPTQLIKDDE